MHVELAAVSVREAVRFISVSQPQAGAFLNAVPSHGHFRLHTWAMRIAVQRRLGLPLSDAVALQAARLSKHGKTFDVLGDVATNDGDSGHQTRHFLILDALVAVLQGVWGAQVMREPADHDFSPGKRPDIALVLADTRCLDLKVLDPIGSSPAAAGLRGAHVGCGNTRPRARLLVRGLAQRGEPGRAFNPATGGGYVAPVPGEYAGAAALGNQPGELLIETFGGFGDVLDELITEAAGERQGKLRRAEYDEASWGTRTWRPFACHQISVAAHRSMAWEIARALDLGISHDPRGLAG